MKLCPLDPRHVSSSAPSFPSPARDLSALASVPFSCVSLGRVLTLSRFKAPSHNITSGHLRTAPDTSGHLRTQKKESFFPEFSAPLRLCVDPLSFPSPARDLSALPSVNREQTGPNESQRELTRPKKLRLNRTPRLQSISCVSRILRCKVPQLSTLNSQRRYQLRRVCPNCDQMRRVTPNWKGGTLPHRCRVHPCPSVVASVIPLSLSHSLLYCVVNFPRTC
jgi:hypothetical protein